MLAYLVRRLLLIIPTLFGIMLINFAVVQVLPGGPVEQVIAELTGQGVAATSRVSQQTGDIAGGGGETRSVASDSSTTGAYRGAQGLSPEFIAELERQFGLDKPAHERFLLMLRNYAVFDFGESFFRGRPVVELVVEKMDVSISIGLWTTLITYLVCIPLGVAKATRDGSRFDLWTSGVIIVGYAIPSFLFAVLLIILFASGTYWEIFPLRGLTSVGSSEWPWYQQVADYFWHIALPVFAMVVGGFATLTMLTKNSFLDQLGQQYVITARAKGLTENRVLYGHVFRNAMLIVIAGFPGAFVAILFGSSLLIEVIFSLDGLGLLGFEAALNRDYPVMFGTLYFFSLLGLLMNIVGDIMYTIVDPRIDFESRTV
ncbi:MAG: microcin C ABC transporter permease YejB [Kiloniellaceae bacterium]